jgi:serine/threonine protein kinase
LNRYLKIHPEAARILDSDASSIPAFVLSCIEEHERQLSSATGAVLKNSPESAVTLVDIPGFPRVCVKQFRWRGWLHAAKGFFRPTQGLRTFRNGWKLLAAGITVASPLALCRERHLGFLANEYVIMEVIPRSLELDRYLLTRIPIPWSTAEKRALAALFGRFIGFMHAEGIFHADLKTCNILVSEEPRRGERAVQDPAATSESQEPSARTVYFALLDYDEVRFGRVVSQKRRIKNLVQIFLSTPVDLRASDRLRFLREYALHVGMGSRQRRQTAVAVIEAARGKEVLYVGFDGDRREQWEARTPL